MENGYTHITIHDDIDLIIRREYNDNRLDRVIYDYTRNGKTFRVVDFRSGCIWGRGNAELINVSQPSARVRTYKHVENAKAKAIEMLEQMK